MSKTTSSGKTQKSKKRRKAHRIKRWQSALIAIALVLLLGLGTSCQNEEEDAGTASEQTTEVTEEESVSREETQEEESEPQKETEEEEENEPQEEPEEEAVAPETAEEAENEPQEEAAAADAAAQEPEAADAAAQEAAADTNASGAGFDLAGIPAYSESPYAVVNDNVPYFTDEEMTSTSFESFSDLDALGRCGAATASLGQDLMPTEERGDISSVHPSGWHSTNYDIVSGESLYNRCHLLAYELTGENANEKNLITGTRYFNVDGMLPFENMVADYIKETGNHVMYRVTPVFEGDNLVASGVLMEAKSVEDQGEGILYCVYCYNVQPGITIDYATGDSWEDGSAAEETADAATASAGDNTASTASAGDAAAATAETGDASAEETYILNNNTMKFHKPTCSSVSQMSDANKQEYSGSRELLIEQGYAPCGICNP